MNILTTYCLYLALAAATANFEQNSNKFYIFMHRHKSST